MRRLKQTDIPKYREELLREQGGKCALCGQPCKIPHLDHAHHLPYIDKVRGVLCKVCNIFLGKLENARIMNAATFTELRRFSPSAHAYIFKDRLTGDWHPSKRVRERRAFWNLKAAAQVLKLKSMGWGKEMPKNKEKRVALFQRLNNKT